MADNLQQILGADGMIGVTKDQPEKDTDVRKWIPWEAPVLPAIRQSGMASFFTCHRMFLFKERLGLVPGRHRSAPFIGSLFHLAHAARWKGLDSVAVEYILSSALFECQARLTAWANDQGDPETAWRFSQQAQREADLARIMSDLHWQAYPGQSPNLRVLSVEEEITAPVEGISTVLGGRLDLLVERQTEPAGLYLVDHKTVSDPPIEWIRTAHFNSQFRLYRILAEARYQRPVVGVIVNLIQRPAIQQKAWQTFDEYKEEITDWYAGRDDTQGSLNENGTPAVFKSGPRKGQKKPRWEHGHRRTAWLTAPPMLSHPVPFDRDPLPKEFYRKLRIVGRACRAEPTLDNFPTTGVDASVCQKHYGRQCPYLPLCSSDCWTWAGQVRAGYHRREEDGLSPDPSDYLEAGEAT